MRTTDYGISDLEPDAIFKLLPSIAQDQDNGSVLALCEGIADAHNKMASKLRAFPRLRDPFLCAAFTPSSFGESLDTFNQWLALQQQSLTPGQQNYVAELAASVSQSVAAYQLEQNALGHLSTLSAFNFNGPRQLRASVRSMIASGLSRSKLRGTRLALFLYGSYSGLYQIKTTDLWERLVPHDAFYVPSSDNDGDFSEFPDVYPMVDNGQVSQKLRYGGNGIVTSLNESSQYPDGDPSYSPFIVDDAGEFNTVTYQYLGKQPSLPNWYNAVVSNDPFGRLLQDVRSHLVPGTFSLVGGSDNTAAAVRLPTVDGSYVEYQAWLPGGYGNNISVVVSIHPNGLRDITITGPLSLRKFKSNWIDLLTTFNPNLGAQFPIMNQVWRTSDATVFDSSLGRTLPGYPLTGTPSGGFIVSDPNSSQVIDQTSIDSINQDILNEVQDEWVPSGTQVRSTSSGFCHIDQITYAPFTPLTSVILSDTNGALWGLSIVDDVPTWSIVTSGSPLQVYQQDTSDTSSAYEWTINPDGTWNLVPYFGTRNDVVFINNGVVGGFVFIDNGIPQFATSPPGSLSNAVHTEPESYAGVVENPPVSAQSFMSQDAVASDATSLQFQTSPEDDLTGQGYFQDNALTGLDPMFSDAMPLEDWGSRFAFDSNGQFVGQDLRNRFAGPAGAIIQAPPSMPRRGDPFRVLNRHGFITYRDRMTQHVYKVTYKRDGTSVVTDLGTLDGPIEPTQNNDNSVSLPTNGLIGPVGQIHSPNLPYEWMPDCVAEMTNINRFTSVTNVGGYVSLNAPDASQFSKGQLMYVRGTTYNQLATCLNGPDATSILTDIPYTSNDSGSLYSDSLAITPITAQTVELTLSPDSSSVIKYIVMVDGSVAYDASANVVFETVLQLAVSGQLIQVFLCSPSTGVSRLQATTPQNTSTGWGGELCFGSSRQSIQATMLTGADAHFYDV